MRVKMFGTNCLKLESPALDSIAVSLGSGAKALASGLNVLLYCRDLLNQIAAAQAANQKELQNVMSQITDWAAKEQADLTSMQGSLAGIVAQQKALNDKITALQNSPGTLSASDQAALDGILAASDALVTQTAAVIAPTPVPAPAGP